jgi:acyl-CoA synthetase (AMP-forming)/AMP-acid ligase II
MNLSLICRRQAGHHGAKTAVVEVPSGRTISYAELERRVDRLAAALLASGATKGARVAVMSRNTIEFIECTLAAARAGMIAQGLNWRLSVTELVRIVRDSAPSVMVTDARFADMAEGLAREVDIPTWLEFGARGDGSYEEFVNGGPVLATMPTTSAHDPVLMMYTGGTTGVPKGVVHSHASCLAAMVNNTVGERIVPSDRYMLLGQMFHSAGILVLNYLYNGATVVLVEQYETGLALETIEVERITAFLGFTTMMNYMLSALASGHSYSLSSLRNLQYGGGPYAPEVIEQIVEAFPCGIIQNYGTTEHVGITFLTQEDHRDARSGRRKDQLRSGGRAAFLTEVALTDDRGKPVPFDGHSKGDIFVRSPANMLGYWNKPKETAAIRRGDWLGTGDVGTIDSDGYLYVVGRAKDMIISGGENIYAAQVERAIAAHPGVLESAVIGEPDEVWGEAVVAYVVRKPGAIVTEDAVKDAVTAQLASYQKPRTVRFVDELPRSPNGKVLKQELVAIAPSATAPLRG